MTKQSAGPAPSGLFQTQSTDHPPLTILSTLPKLPRLSVLCHPHSTFCPFRPFPPSRQRTALYNQPIFMQNKPNSLNSRINATLSATKLYRKIRPDQTRKNKPNQSQFTRNTPPRPLAGRSAMRRTNREPVQSAKMAQEIDPPRTAKRTQRHLTIVPKEIYIPNSESTRQLARVLRIGLLTKTVRHATTVRMRILRVLVPLWQERRERKCNHG